MEKEIGLITENVDVIPEYIRQVKYIFQDSIKIKSYSIEDGTAFLNKKEKIFLVSVNPSKRYEEVRKTFSKGDILIPIHLSFIKRNLLLLNAFGVGSKALLVNKSKRMAEETITSLYQSGITNIEFIPYYPGCIYDESIKLAVTPGEQEIVPPGIEEVVDIDWRHINTLTMAELAIKLDYEYILETKRFLELSEKLLELTNGFSSILLKYKTLRKEFDTLIQTVEGGVIASDSEHRIYACNHQAAMLLGIKQTRLLKESITQFLPESIFERCKLNQVQIKSEICLKETGNIEVTLIPVIRGTQFLGTFTKLSITENKGNRESNKYEVSAKSHITRYSFSDIIGNSKEIQKTIQLAKMMAKTDSSILITGESGTGKELFAHSIHNNSQRAQAPFVAINCAAIPENLLESELFGYEGGSFTGANKNGKLGLFEIASNGTLFLDEIEGMSPSLQIKLLRVLQEREIMRVGGNARIPIDVRIISASNKALLPLTLGGAFRSDLFYRLSTLPIELPPLRKRREDIPILIEEFKAGLNIFFVLTEETKNILFRYDWPGNIRELHNCVEYFGCLNLPVIEPDQLPFYIQNSMNQNQSIIDMNEELPDVILEILSHKACGRKILTQELRMKGFYLTESQVKIQMAKLKEKGLILSNGGRGGSCLTQKGKEELLNRHK